MTPSLFNDKELFSHWHVLSLFRFFVGIRLIVKVLNLFKFFHHF